jgi:hypothetical protein
MGWKKFVSLYHQIENVSLFTIKVKNITHDTDVIITKASPFEYQIDTYYHDTNILTDSHVETSIRNYLGY